LNKIYESDEIVKELLQQDPSTWNAKHRRLIKRYNERNNINNNPINNNNSSSNTEGTLQSTSVSTIEQIDTVQVITTTSMVEKQHNTSDLDSAELTADNVQEEEGEDEEEEGDDNDNEEAEEEDDNNVDDVKEVVENVTIDDKNIDTSHTLDTEQVTSNDLEIVKDNSESMNATTAPSASIKDDIDTELKEMLDHLNSKQRRTLVRQYDRDGNIEQLRLETKRMLNENATNEILKSSMEAQKKEEEKVKEEEDIEEPVKKKARRRKPEVDETKLSPEERIRREEQRRLQSIARMNQTNLVNDNQQHQQVSSSSNELKSKHRHPLNSERRRANRRKPKWESIKKGGTPNEHDTSGYYMRKVTKNEITSGND
jgi:hypothetical protein